MTHLFIVCALGFAMAVSPPQLAGRSAEADEARITAILQQYGGGLRTGDVDLLRRTDHPQAIWTGYSAVELISGPSSTTDEALGAHLAPAASGAYRVVSKDAGGKTAAATVVETSFPGHDFLTHLHLVYPDAGWRITSKLFTVTGPSQPAEPNPGRAAPCTSTP
jgi:hypothetical protein